MSSDLSIGLSGLLAAQKALEITGHNIANANTPGYHKQTPVIVTEQPNASPIGPTGRGVKISAIKRLKDDYLDARILEHRAKLGSVQVKDRFYKELELLFNEFTSTGLTDKLTSFFNSLQDLTIHPESISLRSQVVESAETMAEFLNLQHNELNNMIEFAKDEIESDVDDINDLASELVELNQLIIASQSKEGTPNDLMDRQDALLDDLSELVGITVDRQKNNTLNVSVSGNLLLSSDTAYKISTAANADNDLEVFIEGNTSPVTLTSGELKGLLDVQNDIIPEHRDYLNNLASSIIKEINKIHSEGVGLSGGFKTIISTNAVSDTSAALDTADLGLTFTPEDGTIFINVTNSTTGTVEKNSITIDTSTDSLNDLATKISTITNLTATVNDNKLNISAGTGFEFSFANALDPDPGTLGNSVVNTSGNYTGSKNDTYTLTALGTGTIGTTSGLQIEVKDSSGATVSILDVGDTYSPGSSLNIGNGVSVFFSEDTITTNDTLSFDVINDSDTSNVIAALGINVFFDGKDASDIALSNAISNDPSLIAAATTSSPGDNNNALRLADLQYGSFNVGDVNNTTFNDYLHGFEARIGSQAKRTSRENDTGVAMLASLENRRSALSGVSIDEELLNMVRFQRAYQASARFVSVISDLTNTIFNI